MVVGRNQMGKLGRVSRRLRRTDSKCQQIFQKCFFFFADNSRGEYKVKGRFVKRRKNMNKHVIADKIDPGKRGRAIHNSTREKLIMSRNISA